MNTTTRYIQMKSALPKEAQALIEELLEKERLSDELISELVLAWADEKNKVEKATEAYAKLENAYARLLDRS